MIHFFLFCSALAAVTSPKHYMIDLTVQAQGRPTFSPRMVLMEGHEGKISEASSSGELEVALLASAAGKNDVHLRLLVTSLKEGKREVLGRPTMTVALGRKAKLEQVGKNGSYSIEVLAHDYK